MALAAAALVGAVLACSNAGPPQAGGVSGTYDLARVGHYVFVTSADRSELRVIDARPDGGPSDAPPHDWVRAPNPLEVLQIPVVERPVGLARDLAYSTTSVDELTPAGGEITGPYVYAFAAARPEISVVGADPSQLKELKRLSTDGPVTAVSAIGPQAAGGNSLLLYATLADGGQLYSVSLAPPDQIASQTPAPQLLASYPAGETIVALQALPMRQEVAVATRSLAPSLDGGAPVVSGRTEAVAVTGGARRPLNFGAPIRQLETHPGTADQEIAPEATLFGLVDERSCGGTGGGCAGILAVDVATGQPRTDFSGLPALPINFTRGLPQSLTFTANARVRSRVGGDDAGLREVPVMGLATNTDGQIYFFEAAGRPAVAGGALPDGGFKAQWTLRHINQVSLPGSGSGLLYVGFGADGGITTLPTPAQPQVGADGGELATPYYGPVLSSILTGLGSAVAEPIKVAFEGPIPGLTSVPTTDADGQTFPLPAGAPEERAAVGDRVVISLADATPCGEVALTGKAPLSTTDTIPAACAGRASFTVRAAGAEPYVVTGLVSGYMGRVGDATQAPGQPVTRDAFAFQGTTYYRPDDFDPLNPRPALSFQMGLREPSIRRDAYYQFNTSTGFDPLFFFLSTDGAGWPGYHLPYGVVHLPNTPRVYVSYPSVGRTTLLGSGAVIELDPTFMAPNQANVQITSAYR